MENGIFNRRNLYQYMLIAAVIANINNESISVAANTGSMAYR